MGKLYEIVLMPAVLHMWKFIRGFNVHLHKSVREDDHSGSSNSVYSGITFAFIRWVRCRARVFLGIHIFAFVSAPLLATTTGLPLQLTDVRAAIPFTPKTLNLSRLSLAKPDFSLHFSSTPSDQELEGVSIFASKLVPADGGRRTEGENKSLEIALLSYYANSNKEQVQPLLDFLKEYPSTVWRGSLLTNIGSIYREHGYYSRAILSWQEAWAAEKTEKSTQAQLIADRAVSELARMYSYFGKTKELQLLLDEIKDRKMLGEPALLTEHAREALAVMKTEPETASQCGPLTLLSIQRFLHPTESLNPHLFQSPSTGQGCSLGQLEKLALEMELDYQVRKRTPGTPLVVPSVVHWKSNHYAAILEKIGNGYLVKDPFFQGSTVMSLEAIEEEASGYFLIPKGSLSRGWRRVSDNERKTVTGRGFSPCRDYNTKLVYQDETRPSGEDVAGDWRGVVTYTVLSLLADLQLQATPMGYRPALGPDAHFKIRYSQHESSQPAAFVNTNFGNNWITNWNSYVQAAPNIGGSSVTLTLPNGGTETFDAFNGYTGTENSGSYGPQIQGQATLYVLPTTNPLRTASPPDPNQLRFERHLPDGSKEVYDSPSDAQGNIFLTQIIDPQGNALTFNYETVQMGAQNDYQLASVTDALGQTTILTYGLPDDPLKVTMITDPFGRSAHFQYTSSAPYKLVSLSDVGGMVSQFAYAPGTDQVTSLTTPYGTTTFAVDTSHPLDTVLLITDPDGGREKYCTRFKPEPIAQTPIELLPKTSLVSYAQRAGPHPLQNQTTYYWNKRAMLMAPDDFTQAQVTYYMSDPLLGATSIPYSTKKALESRVWYSYAGASGPNLGTSDRPTAKARVLDDGTTQLFRYAYNSLGKVTQCVDPLGRETDYLFDTNQIDLLQVSQKTATGSDTLSQSTYNFQHEPLTVMGADGQTTRYLYNAVGQITQMTNAMGEVTNYNYTGPNGCGTGSFLTKITGPVAGAVTIYTYDVAGRMLTQTDSQGYTLTYSYDALDRPIATTYPDGTTERKTYHQLDLGTETDRLGRTTAYTYNAVRQPSSVQDPLGRITQYEHCICGVLVKIVDPLGNATQFTYDVRARMETKSYADGTLNQFIYESNTSRLKSTTDALGQTINYLYNPDNTLNSTSYNGSVQPLPKETYQYDRYYNRLTQMTDGTGTTTYAYGPVGQVGGNQLTTITGPLDQSTIIYSYDPLGRVLGTTVNGIGETDTYDSLGRVIQAVNPLGTFSYSYLGQTSRPLQVSYPNGQVTHYRYYPNKGDQRLQQIQNLDSKGTVLSNFTYVYDAVGNIIDWKQEQSGTPTIDITHAYDLGNRLIASQLKAAVPGWPTLTKYVYDRADNRLTEQEDQKVRGATYNNLNQFISLQPWSDLPKVTPSPGSNGMEGLTGPKSYNYDVDGNVLADGVNTYEWDGLNRLTAINELNGQRSEMTYDGASRLVKIIEKPTGPETQTRQFIWVGKSMAEERDADNRVIKRFYPQGVQIEGHAYFYTRDHLNSVRELTDSSAVLQARYRYDDFGRATLISGSANSDFQYAGMFYHAPSALNPNLGRAYNADTGTFLCRDPSGETSGLNLYSVVGRLQ